MILHIDDTLYAQYAAAAQQARRPVHEVIEQQLTRFVAYPPTRRALLVSDEGIAQIEKALRGGSITTERGLLDRIENWAGVTIGHVRLDFSPEQLREIGVRAQKQNKQPKQVVEDIVGQLQEQFFYGPVVLR